MPGGTSIASGVWNLKKCTNVIVFQTVESCTSKHGENSINVLSWL